MKCFVAVLLSVVAAVSSELTDPCGQTCSYTGTYVICGTDGNTYQTKCDFMAAMCKSKLAGATLDVASLGQCRKTDTSGLAIETSGTKPLTSTTDQCAMRCDTTERYEVCGSNGVTYQSKCFFAIAECQYRMKGERLEATAGACSTKPDTSGLAIETSGTKPLTSTNTQCTMMDCSNMDKNPICGTDKNTYANKCDFANAQCKYSLNGGSLDFAYMGECTSSGLTAALG